jgi:hypothetical protein
VVAQVFGEEEEVVSDYGGNSPVTLNGAELFLIRAKEDMV